MKRKNRNKCIFELQTFEQVDKIKYLGIIMNNTFKFREHITYAEEKCTIVIYILPKSAKITWGFRHEVLKIIYEGDILPLLLYGNLV